MTVFDDIKALDKLIKEKIYEPIGLTYYPDGHWELWYGE